MKQISAKGLVSYSDVPTSGKPTKSNRSLPIRPREKLVIYQPGRKVTLEILAQETGQQFHVIGLSLGGMREHKVSARHWRTDAWSAQRRDRGGYQFIKWWFFDAEYDMRGVEIGMNPGASL